MIRTICFLLALMPALASARDLGQWNDAALALWYQSLKQPDNGISCCGEADAWFAQIEVVNGKTFAVIDDDRPDEPRKRRHIPSGTRYEIPAHKMVRTGGNPTGRFVIFIAGNDDVLCFVTGTLS